MDRVRVSTEVFSQGLGRRLDLVYPSTGTDSVEQEEVICHVQGYATQVNLPPVTSRTQYVIQTVLFRTQLIYFQDSPKILQQPNSRL